MLCEYHKREFNDRECLLRHKAAVIRKQRNGFTGFNPCYACPEFIKDGDEIEMAKKGICKGCGRTMSLAALGLCWKCYEAKNKAIEPGGSDSSVTEQQEKPAEITPPESPVSSIVNAVIEKKVIENNILHLNLKMCPGLFEFLYESSQEEYRTMEMQAMYLLRKMMKEQEGVR